MAWDLGNSLNWDLVQRRTYIAAPASIDAEVFIPIPAITLSVQSSVLLIGARNRFAKPRWYLAGSLSPRLLFSPSSKSEFISAVQFQSPIKFGLERLTLIRFRDFDLTPYLLEINIARWHKEMLLEIWSYSGNKSDIEASLQSIEIKLDTALNQ